MELLLEFILSLGLEALVQGGLELFLDSLVRKIVPGPPLPEGEAKIRRMLGWWGLGLAFGLLSMAVRKQHLISNGDVRLALVFAVPLACGAMMAFLGRAMQKRGKPRSSLEHFSSACGFAFFFGAVRYVFCR